MKGRNVVQMNSGSGNICGDVVVAHQLGRFPVVQTDKIMGPYGTNVNGVTIRSGVVTADSLVLGGYDLNACKVTYLKQVDFDSGTYRIKNSGVYRLCENISFNPKPELERKDKPNIGWFAALTTEALDIVFDLNGYTLQASPEFVKEHITKVYSNIELGNAPFPGVPFPLNTIAFQGDTEFKTPDRVWIINGKLGLSSHHGIHGNGCRDVVISGLTISDHEVAGISINSPYNLSITHCDITGSNHTIVNRSRAAQLETLLNSLAIYKDVSDYASHSTNIANALATEITTRTQNPITDPDGNTYGIIIGGAPANGGPRWDKAEADVVPDLGYQKLPVGVNISNVNIYDIHGSPNQQVSVTGVVSVGAYSGTPGVPKLQQLVGNHAGAFGALLWDDFYPDGFAPNAIAKAQTWLLRQRRIELEIEDTVPYFLPVGFEANILDGSPDEATFLAHVKPGFDFDIAHVNKGVFGIKLGCVHGGKVEHCTVSRVRNVASISTLLSDIPAGGNYMPADAGLNKRYIGADAYGISLEYCKNVDISCCKFTDIYSENGHVFDIVVSGESSTNSITNCSGQTVYTDADPEVPDIPNPVGEAYGLLISKSSDNRVVNTQMRNVGCPRFAGGFMVQSGERNQVIDSLCHGAHAYAPVVAGKPKHVWAFSNNTRTEFTGCQASSNYVDGEGGESTLTDSTCRGFYINGPSTLMDSCSAFQNDSGAGRCHGVLFEGDNGYTSGVHTIKNYSSNNNGEGIGFEDDGSGNVHEDNKSAANSTTNVV